MSPPEVTAPVQHVTAAELVALADDPRLPVLGEITCARAAAAAPKTSPTAASRNAGDDNPRPGRAARGTKLVRDTERSFASESAYGSRGIGLARGPPNCLTRHVPRCPQ